MRPRGVVEQVTSCHAFAIVAGHKRLTPRPCDAAFVGNGSHGVGLVNWITWNGSGDGPTDSSLAVGLIHGDAEGSA